MLSIAPRPDLAAEAVRPLQQLAAASDDAPASLMSVADILNEPNVYLTGAAVFNLAAFCCGIGGWCGVLAASPPRLNSSAANPGARRLTSRRWLL